MINQCTSPKLSQMLTFHKMINKPFLNFGSGPELDFEVYHESKYYHIIVNITFIHLNVIQILLGDSKEIVKDSPAKFHNVKPKWRYKDLKQSAQFSPKNWFNR